MPFDIFGKHDGLFLVVLSTYGAIIVGIAGSDHIAGFVDNRVFLAVVVQKLGKVCLLAAEYAASVHGVGLVANCDQRTHGAERFTHGVFVQSGMHNPYAFIGIVFTDFQNVVIEELRFISADHGYIICNEIVYVLRRFDCDCRKRNAGAGFDDGLGYPVVDLRFESDYVVSAEQFMDQQPDQKTGFVAEHGAVDDLNAATVPVSHVFLLSLGKNKIKHIADGKRGQNNLCPTI